MQATGAAVELATSTLHLCARRGVGGREDVPGRRSAEKDVELL